MSYAMISIKPEFVERILAGTKTIELRRRIPGLKPGVKLLIYATLPVGSLVATAVVDDLDVDSPSRIWRRYANGIAITRHQYDAYVMGKDEVCAIKLRNVAALDSELSLRKMRSLISHFHPPQFFARLEQGNPIIEAAGLA